MLDIVAVAMTCVGRTVFRILKSNEFSLLVTITLP